jgi:hypothetical protein
MMATAVVADVDDTAGFMAAARSLKLEQSYGKPPSPEPAENESVNNDTTEFEAATNTVDAFDDLIGKLLPDCFSTEWNFVWLIVATPHRPSCRQHLSCREQHFCREHYSCGTSSRCREWLLGVKRH